MNLFDYTDSPVIMRGIEYAKTGHVQSLRKAGTGYEGTVDGSKTYHVFLSMTDPLKCTCDCQYADVPGSICKHMIALLYKAEPETAERYGNTTENKAFYEDLRYQERIDTIKRYVKSLKKSELQEQLLQYMLREEQLSR